MRYGPEELHAEFGNVFQKVGSLTEVHSTPWGAEQQFVYCYCRLLDSYRRIVRAAAGLRLSPTWRQTTRIGA